jgi:hypothetical protein
VSTQPVHLIKNVRALVYMGVLLIMKLSSEFTFDYKYIINGFRHHNRHVYRYMHTQVLDFRKY